MRTQGPVFHEGNGPCDGHARGTGLAVHFPAGDYPVAWRTLTVYVEPGLPVTGRYWLDCYRGASAPIPFATAAAPDWSFTVPIDNLMHSDCATGGAFDVVFEFDRHTAFQTAAGEPCFSAVGTR